MIRLAEAMAKMEISDEVLPKHVKEAYRLLNKSIIRVEQPDIHLDDDGNENLIDDEEMPAEEIPQQAAKKKLQLSFEDYKILSNKIVVHMRREEERRDEENQEGIKRNDLVEWYLNMISDDVESEEELVEKKELIDKVIDRLIYHVSIGFLGLEGW